MAIKGKISFTVVRSLARSKQWLIVFILICGVFANSIRERKTSVSVDKDQVVALDQLTISSEYGPKADVNEIGYYVFELSSYISVKCVSSVGCSN